MNCFPIAVVRQTPKAVASRDLSFAKFRLQKFNSLDLT